MKGSDKLVSSPVWTIRKFLSEKDWRNGKVFDVIILEGNVLLNSGINYLWTLVCSAGTRFDHANAYMLVGTSAVPAVPTQTGLLGNQAFKGMDTGYPIFGVDQKAVWRATFGAGQANIAWNEMAVTCGIGQPAIYLNRKVSVSGVKVSGQVWEIQLAITLS